MRFRKSITLALVFLTFFQSLAAPVLAGELSNRVRQIGKVLKSRKPKTSKSTPIEHLAREIDWLEQYIDGYGSIVAKHANVWGEARLTKHRAEYEEQLTKEIDQFEVMLNGSISYSDKSFFQNALTMSSILTGDTAAVAQSAAAEEVKQDLDERVKNAEAAATQAQASAAESKKLLEDSIKAQQNRDAASNSLTGIRSAPAIVPSKDDFFRSDKTDLPFINLEPTERLDQLSRYLNHLHELRRVNEGDDTSDSPGYSLNLVRIPISILPGKHTRKGYGAEVTITAEPFMSDLLMPETVRNLVINDVVDQLGLPLVRLVESEVASQEKELRSALGRVTSTAERFKELKENGEPPTKLLDFARQLEEALERFCDATGFDKNRILRSDVDAVIVDLVALVKKQENVDTGEALSGALVSEADSVEALATVADRLRRSLNSSNVWTDAVVDEARDLRSAIHEYAKASDTFDRGGELRTAIALGVENVELLQSESRELAEASDAIRESLESLRGSNEIEADYAVLAQAISASDMFSPIKTEVQRLGEAIAATVEGDAEDVVAANRAKVQLAIDNVISGLSNLQPGSQQRVQGVRQLLRTLSKRIISIRNDRETALASQWSDYASLGSKPTNYRDATIWSEARNEIRSRQNAVAVESIADSIAEQGSNLERRLTEAINGVLDAAITSASGPTSRTRRARHAVPATQVKGAFGARALLCLAKRFGPAYEGKHVRWAGGKNTKEHRVHLVDAQNFLRDELDAAYELLSQPAGLQIWSELIQGDLAALIRSGEFSNVKERRVDFYQFLGKTDPDHPFERVVDECPITHILAWAIVVESALINQHLIQDLRKSKQATGCPCLDSGEDLAFYLPATAQNFGPTRGAFQRATQAFREYVKCRWPIITFALDPFTQEQNLAATSERQRELLLTASLGFLSGRMNLTNFTSFARSLTVNMETVDLNRTAYGFSHGRDTFGWRFAPRLQSPSPPSAIRTWSQTMFGRLGGDSDLREHRIEPGMRECVAIMLMPSFVPYCNFDVRTNWFRLTNPRSTEPTMRQTMKLSRTITSMRNMQNACIQCEHLYRPDEVRRLLKRVEQLDRELPLQSMQVQIPFENTLGGFEMFSTGMTDLGPELIGWYGSPGIIIDPKAAQEATITTQNSTTLFLVGNNFSVHDTKVIAGGEHIPDVKLISREVMQVDIPVWVNKVNVDGDDYVDVHVATPYGVTGHLHIPVVEKKDPTKEELEKLKKEINAPPFKLSASGKVTVYATLDEGKLIPKTMSPETKGNLPKVEFARYSQANKTYEIPKKLNLGVVVQTAKGLKPVGARFDSGAIKDGKTALDHKNLRNGLAAYIKDSLSAESLDENKQVKFKAKLIGKSEWYPPHVLDGDLDVTVKVQTERFPKLEKNDTGGTSNALNLPSSRRTSRALTLFPPALAPPVPN